jgi:hypothetical protein
VGSSSVIHTRSQIGTVSQKEAIQIGDGATRECSATKPTRLIPNEQAASDGNVSRQLGSSTGEGGNILGEAAIAYGSICIEAG